MGTYLLPGFPVEGGSPLDLTYRTQIPCPFLSSPSRLCLMTDPSIHPINLLTHIDGLPLSFALSIFTLLVVVWCMVTHDGIGYEMIKVVKLLLCEHLSVLLLR